MQTSVSSTYASGFEGSIYSAQARETQSGVVEESAGIKPGRVVVQGTSADQVKLPSATAQIAQPGAVQGIAYWKQGREPGGDNGEYQDEESCPVLRKGVVWMLAEDAVTRNAAVYVRCVAGVGEELGRVRSDADTSDAAALPGARFLATTTGADQLVPVEINLPQ